MSKKKESIKKAEGFKKIIILTCPGGAYEENSKYDFVFMVPSSNPDDIAKDILEAKINKTTVFICMYQYKLFESLVKSNLAPVILLPSNETISIFADTIYKVSKLDQNEYTMKLLIAEGMVSVVNNLRSLCGFHITLNGFNILTNSIIDLIDHGSVEDIAKMVINGECEFSIDNSSTSKDKTEEKVKIEGKEENS